MADPAYPAGASEAGTEPESGPAAEERAASRPDEPQNHIRPLPWPPWSGRHGSWRAALAIFTVWIVSLLLALSAQRLSGGTGNFLLSALLQHLPWTTAILWTLFGGPVHGILLLSLCGLLDSHAAAHASAIGQPFGLLIFVLIQHALPFDPRLRTPRGLGICTFASFCAAGASSICALLLGPVFALQQWEPFWIQHFLSSLLLTGPLVCLAGPFIERQKRAFWGLLPPARKSRWQPVLGLLAGLCTLIAFCIVWTIAAFAPLTHSLDQTFTPKTGLGSLDQKLRSATLHIGALVALLLGAVCGGALLVIVLMRRYREQLRLEVNRGTEALRRRHLQLATLQQITEAASRSLDPGAVYQEMAQTIARLTGAAQAAVYAPEDAEHLRLMHQVSVRPPQFEHRARLPVESTLSGQCFASRNILHVQNDLPAYMEPEDLRARFQAHRLDSFLAVPIMGESKILGVVSLSFDSPLIYDEEEQRLFRLVGRAIGGALERAEMHAKARRYANELGGLYRFSQELAAEDKEPRLLQLAARVAQQLSGARSAAAVIIEGSGTAAVLRCAAFAGAPEAGPASPDFSVRLIDCGLIADAIRDNRTLAAAPGRQRPEFRHVLAKGWTACNALIAPFPPALSEQPVGALVLVFDATDAVGLEESGFTEEIARQSSAALRQLRLVEQIRRQAADLKLLEQIGRKLSQRLNVANTLEQLVQNVSKVIPAKWASVFVYDAESRSLRLRATTFSHPDAPNLALPLDAPSLARACFTEDAALYAADMRNDPRCDPDFCRTYGTAAGIGVPLGTPGQRFGVLMVNNPVPGSFSEADIRQLEPLAQLASSAIERARLYEDACQRADDLILLNEAGHLLAENPVLESTLRRIAELVCRTFEGAGAGFLLLDSRRNMLTARGIAGIHARRLKNARIRLDLPDVAAQAFRLNQPQAVEAAASDPRVRPIVLRLIPGLVSGAVVPMSGRDGQIGVLAVWKNQRCRFMPRDLQCLASVARLAAAAVSRDDLGRALHASEERLKEVVDGLHAMIFSIDPHGSILSFNAAAERISGWRRSEVLGRNIAEVTSPSPPERSRVQAFIQTAFQSRNCSQNLIFNWITRAGGERKIRVSASFLRGSEGPPTGMVCLGLDVTDQILLEAQLLQAQKMEPVGALAGGMAHDFNNLLGGIIGQCTLAHAHETDAPALAACIAKIESAAHRGADLTSKLMAFARKSVLQPQPVDIGALITETSELLAGSLPRHIGVQTSLAPSLPRVHGDPTQLQQVLLNLGVNARDAMPGGGTLRLAAAPFFERDSARAGPNGAPAGVLVEVSDTGTGMTEEVQQHLFEPFFTTKERGKGTGLGLPVVFGIVRSHGGQIAVKSQPGQGTCFSIRLPLPHQPAHTRSPQPPVLAGNAASRAAASASPHPAAFGGGETLLVIDDDAMLRDTTRQLLTSLGYAVRTAASGEEALRSAGALPRPALILLDVVMPGLAGPQLVSILRKRLPGAPVVLMSGYSADRTVTEMLEAGARELIQKPFTMEDLSGAIRRALEQQGSGIRGPGSETA